jgi:hypothetical protein
LSARDIEREAAWVARLPAPVADSPAARPNPAVARPKPPLTRTEVLDLLSTKISPQSAARPGRILATRAVEERERRSTDVAHLTGPNGTSYEMRGLLWQPGVTPATESRTYAGLIGGQSVTLMGRTRRRPSRASCASPHGPGARNRSRSVVRPSAALAARLVRFAAGSARGSRRAVTGRLDSSPDLSLLTTSERRSWPGPP